MASDFDHVYSIEVHGDPDYHYKVSSCEGTVELAYKDHTGNATISFGSLAEMIAVAEAMLKLADIAA
jgi:hypothetical protein